jgi:hypothetical protein
VLDEIEIVRHVTAFDRAISITQVGANAELRSKPIAQLCAEQTTRGETHIRRRRLLAQPGLILREKVGEFRPTRIDAEIPLPRLC